MNDFVKNIILWFVVAIVLMTAFEGFTNFGSNSNNTVAYSTFLSDVKSNTLKDVDFKRGEDVISVTKNDGSQYQTVMPMYDEYLLADLAKTNATITGQPEEKRSLWTQILISWFPMLLLILSIICIVSLIIFFISDLFFMSLSYAYYLVVDILTKFLKYFYNQHFKLYIW